MKFSYRIGSDAFDIALEMVGGGYRAEIEGKVYEIEAVMVHAGGLQLRLNGDLVRADWAEGNGKLWVGINGRSYVLEKASVGTRSAVAVADGGNKVRAPMPGRVREVYVAEGGQVDRGQTLLLLEAMKMEMRILAPRDGKIINLTVQTGQQVDKDDVLVEVE